MTNATLRQSLFEAIEKLPVIDAHEHLPEEKVRLEKPADVFTLFSHYTRLDLFNAGMAEQDYRGLFDRSRPLEDRWRTFAPFWERIRWTCFSRPALIAAKRFYGADDINERTYQAISAAIAAANTPGIYDRVLRQACNIRACLTNAFDRSAAIASLEEYLAAAERYVVKSKAEGAVAFKTLTWPQGPPNRAKAEACFARLKSGAVKELPGFGEPAGSNPLRDYLFDEFVRLAGAHGMVVAAHTGFLGTLRHHRPKDLAPLVMRHPEVRFDVYHVGFPRVREALVLAKCQPNVWTNFCGTYLLSPRFAQAALEEAMDLLPTTKIIAFGGDYGAPMGVPVEKVYGHLVMARQTVAAVLARRIEEGQMDQDQALGLARRWFCDNVKELYRLSVPV